MNTFALIGKYLKSKPLIDQAERDIKTMNKSNWKTNTLGLITLALALANIWAPASYKQQLQETAGAFAGAGLMVAADSRKPQN